MMNEAAVVSQITIQLKDVTSMTKEKTAKLIPNAIQISTDSEKVRRPPLLLLQRQDGTG